MGVVLVVVKMVCLMGVLGDDVRVLVSGWCEVCMEGVFYMCV